MSARIDSLVSAKWFAAASAILIFLVVGSLGEAYLHAQRREAEDLRKVEMAAYAATLRARVERELNSLLYLSSGLGSYLLVRNDRIQAKEIGDILAVLHRDSRHVRNFGIAIGYRLSYVYPVAGNEKAIGLDYREQPAQWPLIRRIIESGKPALAGPIDLVQGGSGLVYRVPLYRDGRYWGLLSTVVDSDALFASVFDKPEDSRFEYALRGRDGLGRQGAAILGDAGLFAQPDTVVQDIDIPGGQWAIAVKARTDRAATKRPAAARAVVLLASALFAWLLYALIRSRAELAHQVMVDSLTGLPNRRLLSDRARMAFMRHSRHPETACALLFLDMDDFKDINDRYGHKAGDAVLKATAERCRQVVRAEDTVARWGGDEFVVLLEEVSEAAVETLVGRLREALNAPIDFDGQSIRVGVSIGVAAGCTTGASLDELLKLADHRMYIDKSQRK